MFMFNIKLCEVGFIKELVTTKVNCGVASLILCLGQKVSLEHVTIKTTANGQLAFMFCICIPAGDSSLSFKKWNWKELGQEMRRAFCVYDFVICLLLIFFGLLIKFDCTWLWGSREDDNRFSAVSGRAQRAGPAEQRSHCCLPASDTSSWRSDTPAYTPNPPVTY